MGRNFIAVSGGFAFRPVSYTHLTRNDVARYPPIKRIPFFRESFFRRCASAAGAIYADADADAAPLPAAVVSSAF